MADNRRWWALVVIALAQLMVVLDMTIVNIALPSAQSDLNMSDGNRQWVITAYTLAFGGLLLLGGRIADLVGRRNTFVVGLLGFALASALGGAAANSGMLFGARALQGVFAALLAPSALSLLATTFTDQKDRSKAFGIFGAIIGAGAAIGLLAGGVLTQYLNWRWCLYVNIPIALVAFFGALALLAPGERHPDARLDVPGALLGSAGMLSLVYGFSEAESRSWHDGLVLTLLAAGVVLLAVFGLWQTRARVPLLPMSVVKDRQRIGAFLTVLLVTIGMFGVFLFLTYYLQTVLGWSPLKTGVAYLPMTVAMVVGSTQIAARLLTRVPPRVVIVPGLLLAAGGLVVIAGIGVEPAYASRVLPGMLMLGLGMSSAMMTSVSLATGGVAPRDAGAASATFNTAQQVGGSIGTALLNTIAASVTARYLTAHAGPGVDRRLLAAKATVHGFNVATWWAMGALLVAALVAGVVVNADRAPTMQSAAPKTPEPVDSTL
ncbi:DHA2 family efflux MFS transporter permease subunit [Streptomyces spinosirectus]|uniref:MFS transporter n=1 Tax=Streptomyces TaxID=1883 RepID=UPI000D369F68|nr:MULTISPECIES: MFS transporter [Streptomyces]PTM92448.1 EmrB/QacA subfamily drug resistance transporter [Streptomyces sp. VMFN-G11Ma]UIR18557.1 DHA2 family efflux MFS transporter permease subunit [Streptomyces spinosirectus]